MHIFVPKKIDESQIGPGYFSSLIVADMALVGPCSGVHVGVGLEITRSWKGLGAHLTFVRLLLKRFVYCLSIWLPIKQI